MNLTEDFKNLKLKNNQKYFCSTSEGIDVLTFSICQDDYIYGILSNEKHCFNNIYHSGLIKVLALCSYEELQRLKRQVTKLSKFVNFVGAYTCPKCGEYYLPGYKCHTCGFDATDSEEI